MRWCHYVYMTMTTSTQFECLLIKLLTIQKSYEFEKCILYIILILNFTIIQRDILFFLWDALNCYWFHYTICFYSVERGHLPAHWTVRFMQQRKDTHSHAHCVSVNHCASAGEEHPAPHRRAGSSVTSKTHVWATGNTKRHMTQTHARTGKTKMVMGNSTLTH